MWQSIFTHDMRRYRRTLYARMGDFATLITGPSGTGKELAAMRHRRNRGTCHSTSGDWRSPNDDADSFFPINISALSPTLVESELFGHRRGAFTGRDRGPQGVARNLSGLGLGFSRRAGRPRSGDSGEAAARDRDAHISSVGDTASRQFRGKLIAATNRDLAARSSARARFREDLYYRLCSDQIATPSLAEQLADSPGSAAGAGGLSCRGGRRRRGGGRLAREVMQWIDANLATRYPWPGNYRELEQCVKNVLIRRNYRPSRATTEDPVEEFARSARAGALSADELLAKYVTIAYSRAGSYEETARQLGLDRRTVKAKVDQGLLAKLRPVRA